MSQSLDDYDFNLPEELIAQEPASERDASRLLVLDRETSAVQHRQFRDIIDLLQPGDLLVRNRTRVIPARLFGERAKTGGKAEILLVSPRSDGGWDALLKTRGKPEEGERIALVGGELHAELVKRGQRGSWVIQLDRSDDDGLMDLLARAGTMPLPPYIRREGESDPRASMDRERYQTVYSQEAGAVAAPTAGLHFTEHVFEQLEAKGVRIAEVILHVGLGTFQPIEIDDFSKHEMHAERYEVSAETAAAVNETRAQGGRVVAVGTTAVRSLESAWDDEAGECRTAAGETRIFIHPPMRLRSVDALITNFHLPKSTLLLLVSALAGRERILGAYEEAVAERYRFFSYGDAMLIF